MHVRSSCMVVVVTRRVAGEGCEEGVAERDGRADEVRKRWTRGNVIG